jgi:hypothetical protein
MTEKKCVGSFAGIYGELYWTWRDAHPSKCGTVPNRS